MLAVSGLFFDKTSQPQFSITVGSRIASQNTSAHSIAASSNIAISRSSATSLQISDNYFQAKQALTDFSHTENANPETELSSKIHYAVNAYNKAVQTLNSVRNETTQDAAASKIGEAREQLSGAFFGTVTKPEQNMSRVNDIGISEVTQYTANQMETSEGSVGIYQAYDGSALVNKQELDYNLATRADKVKNMMFGEQGLINQTINKADEQTKALAAAKSNYESLSSRQPGLATEQYTRTMVKINQFNQHIMSSALTSFFA